MFIWTKRERVTNVYNLIVSPTSEGGQNHLYPRYRYRYRCSYGQRERERQIFTI